MALLDMAPDILISPSPSFWTPLNIALISAGVAVVVVVALLLIKKAKKKKEKENK